MFVSHVSNIWWIVYIFYNTYEVYTLNADEGDSFTNCLVVSLLSEWKSNRPYPPAASHFVCVRSRDTFWQMEPFSDLKKILIWIALWIEGLSVHLQHCREFWGWAADQVYPYTGKKSSFFHCPKWLSAWELKDRWNSYSCIICWMGLLMKFCSSIYSHFSYQFPSRWISNKYASGIINDIS